MPEHTHQTDNSSAKHSPITDINNRAKKSGAPGRHNAKILVSLMVVLVLLAGGVLAAGSAIKSSSVPQQLDQISQVSPESLKPEALKNQSPENESKAPASSASQEETAAQAQAAPSEPNIQPGNPVVARYDGKALTRQEVFDFAEKFMGPVAAQVPKEQLFPIALDQLINQQLLLGRANQAGIADKAEVQEELEILKNNHLRTVYLQDELDKRLSDDVLQTAYDEQFADFKGESEIKARHILLKTEEDAKAAIAKLDQGADFQTLAKELSTGPSGPQGGDLGYFTKGRMVPEFESAAFALAKGEYTKTPVQTQFGYHVILVEDLRDQQAPSFDDVKQQLREQLTRLEVQAILTEIRDSAAIELYDINGQ